MPEVTNAKLFFMCGVVLFFAMIFSVMNSDTLTDLSDLQVLLFNNDTDTLISGEGNCYNYTLPNNLFREVVVDARGTISTLPTSSMNLTVFFNGVNVESIGASNGLLSGTFNVPLTVQYGQLQQNTILIEVNATNVTGSPTLLCKSLYVYGIV